MFKEYILKLIENDEIDSAKILLENTDKENLLDGGQLTHEIRGYEIIYRKGIYWVLNPQEIIIAHSDEESDMIKVIHKIIN